MASIGEVIGGLEILAKYTGRDEHCVGAQYDIICAGPADPRVVTAEDAAALDALGWHIDSDLDSWARFT